MKQIKERIIEADTRTTIIFKRRRVMFDISCFLKLSQREERREKEKEKKERKRRKRRKKKRRRREEEKRTPDPVFNIAAVFPKKVFFPVNTTKKKIKKRKRKERKKREEREERDL